ncbi:hypothetical protein [Desulforamulus putei]|uniref:Uncharacterized protein n=1 Tax=Desulforamulus putei DSM 12395 TaxID=1121429 RepID=A0A1M4T1G6_9FIRM|nr:hypothetical protein [Desulforamulus putei]SHE38299.1 hypothetical protein SAMN02745133_00318 [Desulforamulus putei DSM 12395]
MVENKNMEQMVSQLITMVGKVLEGQNDLKAEMTGMKVEINEMKAEMAGMKAEINEMKAEMAGMKAEIHEIRAEMNEMKAEIIEIKNRLNDIDGKLVYLTADVELLEHETRQNKKEINRIKKQIEA